MLLAVVQQERPGAVVPNQAFACFGERAVNDAILADHAAQIHFGDGFDDARTAYARYAEGLDGLFKSGVVRPELGTDDAESHLERFGVDANPFDGAGRRALPAADLRPLERRTRRTRTRQKAILVPEYDLGICSNVYNE